MANEDLDAGMVTLVDEDGHENQFEIIDTLDLGEQHYVALIADYDEGSKKAEDDDEDDEDEDDDDHDDGELVVLKSVMEDGEEFLEAIDDEAEFDQIAAIFMERLADSFEFTEDEAEK